VTTPESNGVFDLIASLPLHPLIVHVVVIVLPLAALAIVALIFVPKIRSHYLIPTLVALLVGAGAAFVAKQSGEQLQNRVGSPGEHAELGENVVPVALALFVASVVWGFAPRIFRTWPKFLTRLLELGIIVLAGAAIVLTVLAGHSGASASWKNRIAVDAIAQSSLETPVEPDVALAPVLSIEIVAEHASLEDCWSVVSGSVYDLTEWIAQHPGGSQRIVTMCGLDATTAFEGQHANQNSATTTLERYLIGAIGDPIP